MSKLSGFADVVLSRFACFRLSFLLGKIEQKRVTSQKSGSMSQSNLSLTLTLLESLLVEDTSDVGLLLF